MKRFLVTIMLAVATAAFGADKDVRVPQYNSTTGAWPQVTISPSVNSLQGFSSDKTAANVTVGSGLSLGSGVLTATNNGLTITATTGALTITNGKVVTFSNTLTFVGTDGSTLNIATGGTLGTAAFTAASAYEVPLTFGNGVTRTVNAIALDAAGLPASIMTHKASDATAVLPVMVYVKGATVLTSGTPADITTIAVPAGVTRYRVVGSTTANSGNMVIAETAAGTLGGAAFQARDTSGGGGNQITSSVNGPASAGAAVSWSSNLTDTVWTSATIYVRQTSNSVNAGTCSFYITIWPLP